MILFWLIIGVLHTVLFFTILYYVVKAAVRNGNIEARQIVDKVVVIQNSVDETEVFKITCPKCKWIYDENYPKCPHCGYVGDQIAKTTCLKCGKLHDIDYPKCPYCR